MGVNSPWESSGSYIETVLASNLVVSVSTAGRPDPAHEDLDGLLAARGQSLRGRTMTVGTTGTMFIMAEAAVVSEGANLYCPKSSSME